MIKNLFNLGRNFGPVASVQKKVGLSSVFVNNYEYLLNEMLKNPPPKPDFDDATMEFEKVPESEWHPYYKWLDQEGRDMLFPKQYPELIKSGIPMYVLQLGKTEGVSWLAKRDCIMQMNIPKDKLDDFVKNADWSPGYTLEWIQKDPPTWHTFNELPIIKHTDYEPAEDH